MRVISIFIIDDHAMIRELCASVLKRVRDFHVVGHTGSPTEAFAFLKSLKPSVILLDVNMGTVSGFQVLKNLIDADPHARVIGLSELSLPAYALKVIQFGGRGYVTKNSRPKELEHGIRAVANGQVFFSNDINGSMSFPHQSAVAGSNFCNLSVREMEVTSLISKGFASKSIAEQMGIRLKTVDVHRHNIMKKLGTKNSAELTRVILELDLFSLKKPI